MASMLEQKVIGVVENMAYLDVTCPHCGETHRVDVFGTGGGRNVSDALTTRLGYEVPLLAEIPLEPAVRAASDDGVPLVALGETRPRRRSSSTWLRGWRHVSAGWPARS